MANLKKLTRVGADVRQIARLLQAKAPKGHMLAYITPEEAELLKSQGGSGKEHEDTGVPSFQMGATGGADYGDYYTTPSGGFDTSGFEDLNRQGAITQPLAQGEYTALPSGGNAQASAPVDLGYQPGTTPANIDLNQAAPTNLGTEAGSRIGERYVPYDMSFGVNNEVPGSRLPSAMSGQVIDTAKEPTFVDKVQNYYNEMKPETLQRLGLAGGLGLLAAYQSNKAQKEAEAAKKEQQALAAPYQTKGAELQRAAQAGELTPAAQQQMQAVQAQASQQAASRGGVGAAQTAAQIEAYRSQLLQQQYDYGLKLSGIGDQIALGAIKTGMQADQYVNQLTSSYYNNIARTLYGVPPAQQTQAGATNG